MNAAGKLIGQNLVDCPVTGDAVHALERICGDLDPEVGFAALAPAAVTFVLVGFIDHVQEIG